MWTASSKNASVLALWAFFSVPSPLMSRAHMRSSWLHPDDWHGMACRALAMLQNIAVSALSADFSNHRAQR